MAALAPLLWWLIIRNGAVVPELVLKSLKKLACDYQPNKILAWSINGLKCCNFELYLKKEICFSNVSVLSVSLVGLLLCNKVQGFWMIHSIPKFPPILKDGYGYPFSGRRNGQIGICVTFKYDQYKVIGNIRVCQKR